MTSDAIQSKHSPGPWGATTRRGSWDWVVYRERDPNHEICQMFHDGTELNELGEANARLIAAAPEMLEALKSARRWFDNGAGEIITAHDAEVADKIEGAIAKAEGR